MGRAASARSAWSARVLWGWIFGVERRVLSFTPAEVTFLFSGPVPRRGLVQYKLLRNQLLILFNSLLWTLDPRARAVRRVALAPGAVHLGAAHDHLVSPAGRLVRAHQPAGARPHRPPAPGGLAGAARRGGDRDRVERRRMRCRTSPRGWAAGPTTFLDALAEAAAEPLPRVAAGAVPRAWSDRWPPIPSREWVRAMGPALGLLVSTNMGDPRGHRVRGGGRRGLPAPRRRQGRRGPAVPRLAHRRRRRCFRLAPVGWPGGALLWKNLLAVVRTRRARNMGVAFVVGAVAGGRALVPGRRHGGRDRRLAGRRPGPRSRS